MEFTHFLLKSSDTPTHAEKRFPSQRTSWQKTALPQQGMRELNTWREGRIKQRVFRGIIKKRKPLWQKREALCALWARITKNTDWNTGPLARPFACSLAPLTRSLARFAHSLARGTVIDLMAIYSVFFSILAHSDLFMRDLRRFSLSPKQLEKKI